ncbi:hypothetical protein Jiend_04410 [Micromonospora endophytica]|nr:hypothetical protein Jiend_04410 [Micromonospora endophytica]
MQAGSLGDRGQRHEPDATPLEGHRFGGHQQILGTTLLVIDRSCPLTHDPTITHLALRYVFRIC